jgi:hypothetical protein
MEHFDLWVVDPTFSNERTSWKDRTPNFLYGGSEMKIRAWVVGPEMDFTTRVQFHGE